MKQLKLAVFASGRGSNFEAIYRAITTGKLYAAVQVVISNNPRAGALDFARQHQIPTEHIARKQFKTGAEFDKALLKLLARYDVNFIVLAGYMKRIRTGIIRAYTHRQEG